MVWVIGGPGSGRGTQCLNLQVKHNYVHLSSGKSTIFEVMSHTNQGGSNQFEDLDKFEALPRICTLFYLLFASLCFKLCFLFSQRWEFIKEKSRILKLFFWSRYWFVSFFLGCIFFFSCLRSCFLSFFLGRKRVFFLFS